MGIHIPDCFRHSQHNDWDGREGGRVGGWDGRRGDTRTFNKESSPSVSGSIALRAYTIDSTVEMHSICKGK